MEKKIIKEQGLVRPVPSKRLYGCPPEEYAVNVRDLVLETVKTNGIALAHASEEIQNDREVVSDAVKQDWEAWYYASEKLRADPKIRKIIEEHHGVRVEIEKREDEV